MYADYALSIRVSEIHEYMVQGRIDATHARGEVLRALMRIDVDRIVLLSWHYWGKHNLVLKNT